ncbi:RICIN domain-containing protein [Lentzea sp. NPDC042327]|uniref:RICIN domain-containing protein n=1 Tax=Lentzea sp. NPDC042327 TaxID=3154801 RepID=UPI0033FE4052
MSKTGSTADRRAGGPRGRKHHRGRLTVITAALGVSALAGAYLGVVWGDSEPVAVDAGAYYRFVSVRSGNALDVAGADGVRIQQEQRSPDAASQQWRLKPVDGGYHQLFNNNSKKVLGVPKASAER